jgi:hypothetical protein
VESDFEAICLRHVKTIRELENERFYSGLVKCMSDSTGNQAHIDRGALIEIVKGLFARIENV